MRTFTLGFGADRKVVSVEVDGCCVSVIEGKADGGSKRGEKRLASEAQATAACEKMARELIGRGFVEQVAETRSSDGTTGRAAKSASPPRKAARAPGLGEVNLQNVFDEDGESASPVLPRLGPVAGGAAVVESEPKKKKKKKSGKKRKAQATPGQEGLDKRVVFGAIAFGAMLVAFLGFVAYDTFLKPATIVGIWKGSRLDYETGGAMSYAQYDLVLDEKKNAAMSIQGGEPSTGTYSVKGDQLSLVFKGSAGEGEDEARGDEVMYKISLGHTTLDLFDPTSGKKLVQLVRMTEAPSVAKETKPRSAPKDLAASAVEKVDKDADAKLATVEFAAKDGAFRVRHPQGWEATTGARPDNSYSWAKFLKGSAKVQVLADVQGSLMSGSDFIRDQEEGSSSAPVHTAHVTYAKSVAGDFNDYRESEPTLFKGSRLGEGRISSFTASEGGLFGGKLKGFRITLLTNNRRVTILCQCPSEEFNVLKATFLAIARSACP